MMNLKTKGRFLEETKIFEESYKAIPSKKSQKKVVSLKYKNTLTFLIFSFLAKIIGAAEGRSNIGSSTITLTCTNLRKKELSGIATHLQTIFLL